MIATPDDAEVEMSVPEIFTGNKQISRFGSAERQQEQLASYMPREAQERQASTNAHGKTEGHPPQSSTLDELPLTRLVHAASQAEVGKASQTRIHGLLELSIDRAGKSLKRRSTLAATEEQKRRKIHILGPENTSLRRFPSSEPLKGNARGTSESRTGRTFNMPVLENSVFYDAADVVSSPFSKASKVDQHVVPLTDRQSFQSEDAHSRIISPVQMDIPRESAQKQASMDSATTNGENEGTVNDGSAGDDNVEGLLIAESAVGDQKSSQQSASHPKRETHPPATTPPDVSPPRVFLNPFPLTLRHTVR